MAQLARKRFTAIRWIAPLAFAGALGLGACGDGSGSDESVRTISPASAAAGSDVHLANQAADIAARTASVDGSDVHLVNMATDTALRTPPSGDTAYGTALEAEGVENDAHLDGNAETYGRDDGTSGNDDPSDDYVPGSRHMPLR